MNRNADKNWNRRLLAAFLRNGVVYTPEALQRAAAGEKALMAQLSYCLLCCKDHICYHEGHVRINIVPNGAGFGWEIENWAALPPALRNALSREFERNLSLTPPRQALPAA